MTIKGDQQRPQIGSLNGNSKLNEQDVEIIRFRAQKKRDELAAKEDRTLSGMVAVLIREGLNIKECEKEKAA